MFLDRNYSLPELELVTAERITTVRFTDVSNLREREEDIRYVGKYQKKRMSTIQKKTNWFPKFSNKKWHEINS